jgi:hypothetical protein
VPKEPKINAQTFTDASGLLFNEKITQELRSFFFALKYGDLITCTSMIRKKGRKGTYFS